MNTRRKKILFIAVHEFNRAPGQRFRFEQYLSFLKEQGWEFKLSMLLSQNDYNFFYKKGHYFQKILIFIRSFIKRAIDAYRASKYDIIFIQREALMTRHIIFEKIFARSTAKVVFDFDDSIWMQNVSKANKVFAWLKDANKTPKIIALSDMIFAGNPFLYNYASKFNSNVRIVPTTIDTDVYVKKRNSNSFNKNSVCIGWSGSFSTIEHFQFAIPALVEIKNRYGDKVSFIVIGDKNYKNQELGIKGVDWKFETEIEDLSDIDIGIMPLPDNEWAKGKCGLKGLQYMALEIPTIMSPVGVNTEIISDGINGFLASSSEEWIEKLSKLVESEDLRKKLGKSGRETVIEKYSVNANKHVYLKYFTELITN